MAIRIVTREPIGFDAWWLCQPIIQSLSRPQPFACDKIEYLMKTMRISTLRVLAAACTVSAFTVAACIGQEVPQGVHYKRATPEVNAKAKAALEQALANPGNPTNFLLGTVSVGPILWNDLKDSQEVLSKDSTPVTVILSVPEAIKAEGRGLRTQEQRERLWKLVMDKYPGLRKGIVRPAKSSEIQFYWATIPFDIEEPFFAIETPSDVFIAQLTFEKGKPALFWLDRVDDLRKLKK